MKVGDYIICKSIPEDAPEGALTIDKVYKIEMIRNSHDEKYKVYVIFTDDNYPYMILRDVNKNFEPIRNRNLEILLNNKDNN